LYVNGKIIHTYNSSSNVSTDYPLMLGRDGSSRRDNFFPGFLDEIKIFNYGWTSTEVSNEFRRFSL
ncbi:MAG: LamG domain-containing protein, partial [Chitinispirillaceae bacterium]|nr:LamG domain-containing protein [Chitinispirillaceae bacterium]